MKYSFTRLSALFSTVLVTASTGYAEPLVVGIYKLTPQNTQVDFAIDNFWGLITTRGKFVALHGDLAFAEQWQNSRVDVTIETKSIDTNIGKRDEHLRSADYFAVDIYPTMHFRSTKVSGSPEAFEIEGLLTLKAVAKTVILKGSLDKAVAEVTASTTINRQDFGVTLGGKGLSDEVLIELKVRPNSTFDK